MKLELKRVFQISFTRINLLLPIAIAALFLVGCAATGTGVEATASPAADEAQGQEVAGEISSGANATLPPPIVVEASNTPVPATNTPEATATPENTSTPEATEVPPTDTPAPIPPTSTPAPVQPTSPPPPTEIPEPTSPPPPEKGANGLVASHFALQERSNYSAGGKVWYDFTVSNSTGNEVPYNALGVMPKKDGVDRFEWYQQTYGGPNSTIKPGGLTWEDRIELPEAGSYTLRLVICFDGFNNCLQGGGAWQTLSDEVPVQIN
jgi:hypothetical protein